MATVALGVLCSALHSTALNKNFLGIFFAYGVLNKGGGPSTGLDLAILWCTECCMNTDGVFLWVTISEHIAL